MIVKLNQEELKRHREIILATINYSLEKSAITMKVDGKNPWESNYQKLKQETEKNFQEGNLEKLQQTLTKVLEFPLTRADFSFDNFIQEKTGYEIKILMTIRILEKLI